MIDIQALIPHRDPFLFVDLVLSLEETSILAEKTFHATDDFYRGHYPGNPITPGVLLCETVFQTAAILVLKRVPLKPDMMPVLARIEDARFKAIVRPEEKLHIKAQLQERCGKFFLMSGEILKEPDRKQALKIQFSLALTEQK
ncbi:MAG: beta-hydroxyacyl-ACP dehydratase [Opitutales bacterium]|nr:beta-hydroxyacyl-ACP dehydratase [Opitutales bacterium]